MSEPTQSQYARLMPQVLRDLAVNHAVEVAADLDGAHNLPKTGRVNPVDFWTYESRMAAQLVYIDKGDDSGAFQLDVRRPYGQAQRTEGIAYNAAQHFMEHETRQRLDEILHSVRRYNGDPATYIIVSINANGTAARERADEWVRARIKAGILDGQRNERYTMVYCSFFDEGFLLGISSDCDLKSLADMGIFLSADPKSGKRMKRFASSHLFWLRFHIERHLTVQTGNGLVYTLTHEGLNRTFTLLDFDMTSLSAEETMFVDGMNVANLYYRITGDPHMQHVKPTADIGDVGTVKGFGHAIEQVTYDFVAYGIKHELIVQGDWAYFGVIGTLHLHEAYMDIQTMTNMGFYEPHLAPAEGRFWIDNISSAATDEDEYRIRDMIVMLARIVLANDDANNTVMTKDISTMFPSIRAMLMQYETKALAVLFRRWFQTAFENSVDLTHGRIPMMRVFKRLNICPNLLAFTSTGRPSRALDALSDRSRFPHVPVGMPIVCAPDLPEGRMWIARNPNTHSGEAVVVWNVHLIELMTYRNRGLCFFSFDACHLLVRLNGADMDDSVLATTNAAYIDKWLSLSYPVVPKIEFVDGGTKRGKVQGPNPVNERDAIKYESQVPMWTWVNLFEDLDRWVKTTVGLGTFINRIMLDIFLSGEHKAAILESLQAGTFAVPKNFSEGDPAVFIKDIVLPFLKGREDFMLRRETSNSDLVIDWLQMHKGDPELVNELISHSASVLVFTRPGKKPAAIPCFPMSYAKKGRIPRKRLEAGDYILVETKVCQALASLEELRNQVIEFARQKEHRLVRPLPTAVLNFWGAEVGDEFVMENAKMLRAEWLRLLEYFKAANHGSMSADVYKWAAHGRELRVVIKPTDPDYNHKKAQAEKSAKRPVTDQFRAVHEPGLYESYFYMLGSDGVSQVAVPKELRLATAVVMYSRAYENAREPIIGEDGFTRSFSDGYPDFVLNDLLTATADAGATGWVVLVELNHFAQARLTEPVTVVAKDGRVYRKYDDRRLGICPELPSGTYTMSPKGVIVVQESDPELHSTFQVEEVARQVKGDMEDAFAIENDDFEL